MKFKPFQKGFTLIELLVVVAIISLLSSIVLASVREAREKAMLSKTVSEMKSLQTALELYRNEFGVYPGGERTYADDNSALSHVNNYISYADGLDDLIQTELVDRKFISKVPHAPNYPNNCVNNSDGQDCVYLGGYVLGYSTYDLAAGTNAFFKDVDSLFTCGNQKVKNYIIYLITPIDKKLNLPILYFDGVTLWEYHNLNPQNIYCLSM